VLSVWYCLLSICFIVWCVFVLLCRYNRHLCCLTRTFTNKELIIIFINNNSNNIHTQLTVMWRRVKKWEFFKNVRIWIYIYIYIYI
jgi:hypothetical protein